MKFLLDTHVLLWAAGQPDRLSTEAREILENVDSKLFFSPASLWEISIKSGLKRSDFKVDPRLLRRGLLNNGYIELPIMSEHTISVYNLPPIHKDPFDRLLIAQSMIEGITLLTSDLLIAQYSGPIKLI